MRYRDALGIALGFLLAATLTWAAAGIQTVDDGKGGKIGIQGFAPKTGGEIPVGKSTVHVTGTGWAAYVGASGAVYRMDNYSTLTHGGQTYPLPNGSWHERRLPVTGIAYVHYSTPTAGVYQTD